MHVNIGKLLHDKKKLLHQSTQMMIVGATGQAKSSPKQKSSTQMMINGVHGTSVGIRMVKGPLAEQELSKTGNAW